MRKHARIDANHKEIVSVLRQCGCSVQSLASIGHGCPDLLVARGGAMWLMEVKDGKKMPSERRLTPDEKEWHSKWRAPVWTVESVADALKVINRLTDTGLETGANLCRQGRG